MPRKDPEARKAYLREYAKKNPSYGRVKKWKKENPEKVAEANKRYAEKHPEKLREKSLRNKAKNIEKVRERDRINAAIYREKNRETVLANKRKYQKNNMPKINAAVAKRKSALLQRTPAWLSEDDLWLIEQAYELAALRTKMFGFKWHVDHMYPLQGKIVSGLHVPENLRVIPWRDNLRKGNRIEVHAE